MFEAVLHASSPDTQRNQRLMLAASIAVATMTALFATTWTFDKFGIDRIGGPHSTLEVMQFSLLPTPPPPATPKVPEDEAEDTRAAGPAAAATEVLEESPDEVFARPHAPSGEIPSGKATGDGSSKIPSIGGPAGVCGKGPIACAPSTGTCVGPHCRTSDPGPASLPPADVEFSALRCLACADPNQDQLRKTVSSLHKRQGSVTVDFCVAGDGRVERGSLRITRSFGDSGVDNIVRDAVGGWRFAPMKVAGKTRRACSSRRFNIRFD